MTIKLEDLNARAMFYEFTADEDQEGASWSRVSESDREGWRRVAEYVDRVIKSVREDVREVVDGHAWGEEDPLAVRDAIYALLRGAR